MGQCINRFGLGRDIEQHTKSAPAMPGELLSSHSAEKEHSSAGEPATDWECLEPTEREVLQYVREISNSTGWVLHMATPTISVRTLSGSMYHDSVPVLQVYVKTHFAVPNYWLQQLFVQQPPHSPSAGWTKLVQQANAVVSKDEETPERLGFVYFSVVELTAGESTTCVCLTSQVERGTPSSSETEKILAEEGLSWARACVAQLEQQRL